MSYTYILISLKDGKKYIGSTIDLNQRILEHNKGRVDSTKNRRPIKLLGYREFDSIAEATIYEKKYKKSHDHLERDIKNGKIIINGD